MTHPNTFNFSEVKMINIIKMTFVAFAVVMSSITAQECCGVAEDFSIVADENLVDVFAIGNTNDINVHVPSMANEVGEHKALFMTGTNRTQVLGTNDRNSLLVVAETQLGHVNLVNSSGNIQHIVTSVGSIKAVTYGKGLFALLSSENEILFVNESGLSKARVVISDKVQTNDISFGNGMFVVTSSDGYVYFFKNPNADDLTLPNHNGYLPSLIYTQDQVTNASVPVRKVFTKFAAKQVAFGDGVFVITHSQDNCVSVFDHHGVAVDFHTREKVSEDNMHLEHKFAASITYGAGTFVVAGSDFSQSSVTILRKGKAIQHVELVDAQGNIGLGISAVSFLPQQKNADQGIFAIAASANNRIYFMTLGGKILGSQETIDSPTSVTAFRAHKHAFNMANTTTANTFENVIRQLGGSAVKSTMFPKTIAGFQMYLDAVGVRYFSAREMTTPNHPDKAKQCGFDHFLPPHEDWAKGAALALLADKLRALVNEPVKMRNWWRPSCYNSKVGGAAGSDHVQAFAVDLDFRSAQSRAKAQGYLCKNYWSSDLQLSIGLGGVTIHLGILSPKGKRSWKYSSYTKLPNSGNCW